MVPEVHRQAVVRAAPLSSPKISPIFLKKYFVVIFQNVLLNLQGPEFHLTLQLCVDRVVAGLYMYRMPYRNLGADYFVAVVWVAHPRLGFEITH